VSPTPPTGYRAQKSNELDCDDANPNKNPGLPEICDDGIDNNCDGNVDEGCTNPTYTFYRDQDQDGHTTSQTMTSSDPNPPAGWRAQPSQEEDCADNDSSRHPGAVEVCGNNLDDNCDGNVDEGCTTDCTDGETRACTCAGGEAGSQTCAGGDWTMCECAQGTVTLKYEVDCSAQSAFLNPEPEGSWAGRNYGPLTGCVSTGAKKTACTFDIPAPDYPTFIGQGHAGFNRYAGDGSGNAPAPCVTPEDVAAMQGHSITLLCTVRLWKDGQPVSERWESNGVIKPSGTQSCSESGDFPYYNSRPLVQTMSGTMTSVPVADEQYIGMRFVAGEETFYYMGKAHGGWKRLEKMDLSQVIWLGNKNPHVRRYFPSLFLAE